jgi:hypothetical protein
MGIFLFATTSRWLTQSSIQWIPMTLNSGVKRPELEADHSPPSSDEIKNAWNDTSNPPLRPGTYSAGSRVSRMNCTGCWSLSLH